MHLNTVLLKQLLSLIGKLVWIKYFEGHRFSLSIFRLAKNTYPFLLSQSYQLSRLSGHRPVISPYYRSD
jgi:hypothetical protein